MNLRLQKIIALPLCLIFLIGMAIAGNGNILCIGDNGRVKFETLCLPCCDEAEKSYEADEPNELQNEHDECCDCSDVELDYPRWSKRIQTINSDYFDGFVTALDTDAQLSLISAFNTNSQIIKFHLAFGQSPPSYTISTTVFRC